MFNYAFLFFLHLLCSSFWSLSLSTHQLFFLRVALLLFLPSQCLPKHPYLRPHHLVFPALSRPPIFPPPTRPILPARPSISCRAFSDSACLSVFLISLSVSFTTCLPWPPSISVLSPPFPTHSSCSFFSFLIFPFWLFVFLKILTCIHHLLSSVLPSLYLSSFSYFSYSFFLLVLLFADLSPLTLIVSLYPSPSSFLFPSLPLPPILLAASSSSSSSSSLLVPFPGSPQPSILCVFLCF